MRAGKIVVLLGLAVQLGCQRTAGTLSPRYEEASAPRVYHFRSLYPRISSIFGTSDGKRLWAVGANGAILESNGGEYWNARTSGTPNDLHSIFVTSDGERLWAVGDAGTILESTDGEHWKADTSGTPNRLYSIFGTSGGKLWAVGDNGAILKSSDGEHWEALASGTPAALYSIFGTGDGKRLWAVGRAGTILESTDGEHWKARTSGTSNHLFSIFGTSDGKLRLWAVGLEGTILESSDGERWSARTSGTKNTLNSIFGTSGGKLWAVGDDGTILKSSDGEHWEALASGTPAALHSIFGTSDGNRLWAVGEEGTILESRYGMRWNELTGATRILLRSIFGTSDGKRLWAVGDKGTILESSDGEHWNALASGTKNSLNSIFGTNDGKLWAVGDEGTILESSDGEHWNALTSGTPNRLNSIFGTNNGKRLWAVGDKGTILESSDGEHWDGLTSGTQKFLNAIFATIDGKGLWVVGEAGTILASSDGEHWILRPSGTTNNLSSIFGASDGRGLWAVGEEGTILESSDGEHWIPRSSGTAKILTSIFGTGDGKRLWAASELGKILESSGGEHWNARETMMPDILTSIFVTSDGKRLWAVGGEGTIIAATADSTAPFITEGQLSSGANGDFLELTMSGRAGIDHISVSALNDYEYDLNKRGQREWPPPAHCAQVKQSERWRCGLDKSTLHPEVKAGSTLVPTLHFLIKVSREGGEDTYEFAAPYNPWAIITDHPEIVSVVGIILVLAVIPTIFLFVRPLWNIRIYRALKLNHIEKIKIPGLGPLVHLVTVLPWFIKRRRTLDAWVLENRAALMRSWAKDIYIPLPIRKGDPLSGEQILQPGASDIRATITAPRATIQIVGPGGAGKTTLARQIGRWGFENGPEFGIADYPMIPIWVDEELDPDKNSLRDVVKGKLTAALPNEDVDDVLFGALLEKQRLLVFVDRLSERSVTTQDHVRTIYRSSKIGLLVVTSRTGHIIDGAQSANIYPQPLNSATLLRFMTELLPVLLTESEGAKPFSTIEEQCNLGSRLAGLIRIRTGQGELDVPLTPLPVRRFVEQAVELVREGKPLDDLPISLPEVYLRQLRIVNPQDATVPHFVDDDRMLKVAKTLAKTALGGDFIPREFNRADAVKALLAVGESVTAGCDPIKRLALNGVLIEKQGGRDVRLRFTLDPVAEILAAVAYGEECGRDIEKWNSLELESRVAPGFETALELVWAAYWWPEGESILNWIGRPR